MDMTTSPEQSEIIESTRSFLARRQPITRIRELLGTKTKVDDSVWREAAELGWLAIGLPEECGGVGLGLVEEALLFREIGRGLSTGPWLSSVLAARVAALGGNPALAAAIVDGTERVGLVLGGTGPDRSESVQLLDVDGAYALWMNEGAASIVDVRQFTEVLEVGCVDPSCTLKRARSSDKIAVAAIDAEVDPIARRGKVLCAAMLVGMSEAVRDIAATHAKNRVQFDKPIGVNQAVKHPCADMAVRSELAYAQTLFGALAHDEARVDAELQAAIAFAVAVEAAVQGGDAAVQILGGMGFTFEADVHFYVKRAKVVGRIFGGAGNMYRHLLSLPEAS